MSIDDKIPVELGIEFIMREFDMESKDPACREAHLIKGIIDNQYCVDIRPCHYKTLAGYHRKCNLYVGKDDEL